MPQPEGVAQLVQGDPVQVLGVIRLAVQAWWQVGADQDVGRRWAPQMAEPPNTTPPAVGT